MFSFFTVFLFLFRNGSGIPSVVFFPFSETTLEFPHLCFPFSLFVSEMALEFPYFPSPPHVGDRRAWAVARLRQRNGAIWMFFFPESEAKGSLLVSKGSLRGGLPDRQRQKKRHLAAFAAYRSFVPCFAVVLVNFLVN